MLPAPQEMTPISGRTAFRNRYPVLVLEPWCPTCKTSAFRLAPLFTRSVSAVFSMSPVSRKLVLP